MWVLVEKSWLSWAWHFKAKFEVFLKNFITFESGWKCLIFTLFWKIIFWKWCEIAIPYLVKTCKLHFRYLRTANFLNGNFSLQKRNTIYSGLHWWCNHCKNWRDCYILTTQKKGKLDMMKSFQKGGLKLFLYCSDFCLIETVVLLWKLTENFVLDTFFLKFFFLRFWALKTPRFGEFN